VTLVLLVRHGLTAGTGNVLTGRTPGIPLDDRGREQAAALASRLAEAGLFGLFLQQQASQDRFWFGQEAGGSPSGPWGWDDLD